MRRLAVDMGGVIRKKLGYHYISGNPAFSSP